MGRLTSIRLRHLEIFTEVARLGSVSRAADSLGMTQPGVTRTIRELEAICGRALVAKDGRGIRITPHGEVFLRHAGGSIAAVRNGLTALEQLDLDDGPPLRIGALPTVSATLMPDAVALFLESGARTPLVVVTGDNRVLLDQLRRGDLDLVMGRLAAPDLMHGLEFEPLYTDSIVFGVAPDHPLAGARQVTADDLTRWPIMIPTRNAIIRPIVERFFIEQGFILPPKAIETVSDSFGRAFVRRHRAIWIISRGVVAAELDAGEMAALPIDTRTTLGPVGINLRADGDRHAAVDMFVRMLRSALDARKP